MESGKLHRPPCLPIQEPPSRLENDQPPFRNNEEVQRMANKRPVDNKSSAPARFPAHFDKEVTPRLAAMCAVWGNLVACDAYDFGEALSLIWARAWKLGAGYL